MPLPICTSPQENSSLSSEEGQRERKAEVVATAAYFADALSLSSTAYGTVLHPDYPTGSMLTSISTTQEIMGDASLGRYVANPRMRVQKAEVRPFSLHIPVPMLMIQMTS